MKRKLFRHYLLLAVAFRLLQKSLEPVVGNDTETTLREDENERSRIRCPHCLWQPNPSSRWVCWTVGPPENFAGGCGTRWNTFDTRGLCPGCSYQWRWTICLNCYEWALHEDWYENRHPAE